MALSFTWNSFNRIVCNISQFFCVCPAIESVYLRPLMWIFIRFRSLRNIHRMERQWRVWQAMNVEMLSMFSSTRAYSLHWLYALPGGPPGLLLLIAGMVILYPMSRAVFVLAYLMPPLMLSLSSYARCRHIFFFLCAETFGQFHKAVIPERASSLLRRRKKLCLVSKSHDR